MVPALVAILVLLAAALVILAIQVTRRGDGAHRK